MKPITNVDWELLRDQKGVLLDVMSDLDEEVTVTECISAEYATASAETVSPAFSICWIQYRTTL